MSGDVFGNGMLLSHKIRLVAAFDHRHIFIDPNPDTETSFAERARLFTVPRSSWDDFDRTVMSPGGGVWPRSAKSIRLPLEARAALGITEENLTPQELIRAILCAPVDLLWNGGVGTYVKASTESNVDAADPSNDAVRVSADELRATVVGEGGNLGFTQRARIEYAAGGGRINADFIDNAAGVATSDREVNIKIALAALDSTSRNELLAAAQDEVAASVLEASEDQTLAISLAEHRAPALLDQHERLIENLVSAGAMKRLEESLPDAKALAVRARAGQGLLRPELAVLVAQSKNVLTAELGASTVPDNQIFADRLPQYFPLSVVEAAPDAVRAHRLGRDIIITSVVDELVNPRRPRRVVPAGGTPRSPQSGSGSGLRSGQRSARHRGTSARDLELGAARHRAVAGSRSLAAVVGIRDELGVASPGSSRPVHREPASRHRSMGRAGAGSHRRAVGK